MRQSQYHCPECGKPLCVDTEGENYVIWCEHGPCNSFVCNDGFVAKTEQQAFDGLRAAWLKEPKGEE